MDECIVMFNIANRKFSKSTVIPKWDDAKHAYMSLNIKRKITLWIFGFACIKYFTVKTCNSFQKMCIKVGRRYILCKMSN